MFAKAPQRNIFLKVLLSIFFTFMLGSSCAFAMSAEPQFKGCDGHIAWKIIDAENHRDPTATIFHEVLSQPSDGEVSSTSLFCTALAIQALGRIGSTSSVDQVSVFLNDVNINIRKISAFALGLIGGDSAIKLLESRLDIEESSDVRAILLRSLCRIGGEPQVKKISRVLESALSPNEVAAAAQGIGLLWQKDSAGWSVPDTLISRLVLKTQSADRDESISAAFALSRFKGSATQFPSQDVLMAIPKDIFPESQGLLMRAVGKQSSQLSSEALCAMLPLPQMTQGLYVEALKALANVKINKCIDDFFISALHNKSSSVRVQALLSVKKFKADMSQNLKSEILKILESRSSPWEKEEALITLAIVDPALASPFIDHNLSSSNLVKIRQGLKALASLNPSPGQFEDLVRLLQHRKAYIVEDALAVISSVSETSLVNFPGGIIHLQNILRALLAKGDMGIIATISDLAKDKKWGILAMDLANSYDKLTSAGDVEAKISVLNALAEIGSHDIVRNLQIALKDDERLVGLAAAGAIKKITSQDVSNQVPERSVIRGTTPAIQELIKATQCRLEVATTKGRFFVDMSDQAPLTSANIVRLSQNGFYNGLTFHRIVPNFVAQGGDPRGDGYGGPGYLIRDEASLESHARGAVGVATAGKDTGGSQFFVNYAANLHLDGNYTVFGNVSGGMENIDKLENGDRILKVSVSQ